MRHKRRDRDRDRDAPDGAIGIGGACGAGSSASVPVPIENETNGMLSPMTLSSVPDPAPVPTANDSTQITTYELENKKGGNLWLLQRNLRT